MKKVVKKAVKLIPVIVMAVFMVSPTMGSAKGAANESEIYASAMNMLVESAKVDYREGMSQREFTEGISNQNAKTLAIAIYKGVNGEDDGGMALKRFIDNGGSADDFPARGFWKKLRDTLRLLAELIDIWV